MPLTRQATEAGQLPHPDQVMAVYQRVWEAARASGGTPDFSAQHVATHVAAVYGNMPHPQVPSLKVNEVAAYERVAWMLNDKKPTPTDVEHAATTLKQAGISPADFETTWAVARPVANRLLDGRDPTMVQLKQLVGKSPQEVHDYFSGHPFPGYEEVTAGQMVRHWRAAEAIARQYGRAPNHEEVSRFAAAGYTADDMHSHYGGG